MTFHWRRHDRGSHGVLWTLHHGRLEVGRCFFLSGSRRWRCSGTAPSKGGVVLTDYYAGTATAARHCLERDWDKRLIGLFGEDYISFEEEAACTSS